MIEEILNSLDLKKESRTGWELKGISNPESVADHSWGVCLLTFLFGHTEDINMEKALKMAVVHDLAEVETGDIVSRADEEDQEVSDREKEQMELEAILDISRDLERNQIKQLWKEYNMGNTPESKFVKDMDKIELCLQALKYYRDGCYDPEEDQDNVEYEELDEFFETSERDISTEVGKELFSEIRSRYQNQKNSEDSS